MSRQRQLTSFARALRKYSGLKPDKFSDWFDAFDALLRDTKKYMPGRD